MKSLLYILRFHFLVKTNFVIAFAQIGPGMKNKKL